MRYFVTFFLALASLVYELVLAQTLSATLGGTTLRYATTFGLYTFALGIGSGLYPKAKSSFGHIRVLLTTEIILCFLGATSPFMIVFLDPARFQPHLSQILVILSYTPIFLVGLFSGLELPALISFCKNKKDEFRVLASDYLGMFIGSVIFPALLLMHLGTFGVSLLLATINGVICLFLALSGDRPFPKTILFAVLLSVGWGTALLNSETLFRLGSSLYLDTN